MRPCVGDNVNYRHVASDNVYGPVRVVAIHDGSNQLIVTNDPFIGRTFSLMLDVTIVERASLQFPVAEGSSC